MQRVQKQGSESENAQRTAQAKFTSWSRENERANAIDDSPAMIAQRKKLNSLFGGAIQRQGAEEEMLQGKFDGVQRVEEEEPLQGKFETAQRVEEEEPLQGKFDVAQRVEEEEPLQGKFEAVQRVEEEEPLQGKFETAQRVEDEEPLQGKFEAVQRVEEEEPLQGKFEAASSTQLKEEVAKPNNTGLPDNLKSGIENLSGMSMDNVKVHYNSSQPAQLNALAYAQGTDIHVAPGQEQHLPHEAWHVVQQAQGRVKPTMQMKEGVPVNDDKSLEHEADVMGAKAASVGVAQAMNKLIEPKVVGSTPFQCKTEIDNKSVDQAYRSDGDISQQRMGVEMEAYLDPWNPLHGTESAAFDRHGIYLDEAYNEGNDGATAMHLLNANLGGLAVDENLFPGHTNKNGQHLKSGETEVKNKVLTLMNNGKKGWRVFYKVRFSPPSVLTPENFTTVPLQVQHCYVSPEDQMVLDWVTVSEKPNVELDEAGWKTSTSKVRNRRATRTRKYLHKNTEGERATFVELVKHEDDPDSEALRFHTHVAHEDKDDLLS
ncbi:MAG TPA: DUF4157 domain-containing protein [Gallionella sp.]|nr:DUF4157 domain-containing protein [Gallionella sp.]